MPISVQCPKCGLKMRAPDSAVGKRIRCKRCQQALTVSGATQATAQQPQLLITSPMANTAKKGGGLKWALVGLVLIAALAAGGYFMWPTLASMLFDDAKSKGGTPVAQAKDKNKPWTDKEQPTKDSSATTDKIPVPVKDKEDTPPPPMPKKKKDKETAVQPAPDKEKPKKDGAIPDFPDIDPQGKKGKKIEGPTKTPDGALTVAIHPKQALRFMAVSPDGKTLYTAAWDNELRTWDLDTLIEKSSLPLPKPDKEPNTRLQAALSPDGKSILFNHWDVLQILTLESQKVEQFTRPPKQTSHIGDIRISADGSTALTESGFWFAVWNVPERKFIAELKYDNSGLASGNSFALAPDAKFWIHTANNSDGARLLLLPDCKRIGDCAGLEKLQSIDEISSHPSYPVVSPTGKRLAYAQSCKGVRTIRVFDLATRKLLQEMPFPKMGKSTLNPSVEQITFAPDEKSLLVLDDHRWVRGYDLEAGKMVGAFQVDRSPVTGNDAKFIAITRDESRVIIGLDNWVKVWDRAALPLKKE